MKKAANDIKRCVACGACVLQCPREGICKIKARKGVENHDVKRES